MGLPGFSGFIAELQVFGATLSVSRWAAVLAAVGALVTTGLAPTADKVPVVEHAAWTVVARAILTLAETTTRN